MPTIKRRAAGFSSALCGLLLSSLAACGGTTSTPDMSGSNVMVTGLPTSCAPGVTATTLFNNTFMPQCSLSSCHGATGFQYFSATTAAEMKTALLDKASETTEMPRATADNVNASYVLYKLIPVSQGSMLSQGAKAGGSNTLMPYGAPNPLSQTDLCNFVSWIQSGAM